MDTILTLDNIEIMAGMAFKNGLKLHDDSITLFNSKSYSTAFFLSVLALEEFGKAYMLDDMWFHKSLNENSSLENELKDLKRLYEHKTKQLYFIQNIRWSGRQNKLLQEIEKGSFEILKQNSIYVGLKKLNKKIVFEKNINNPSRHNKSKTRDLITLINDKLLIDCISEIKEFGGPDIDSVSRQLNKKLYNKLIWAWPLKGKRTDKELSEMLEAN